MHTRTRMLLGLCLLTAAGCDESAENRKPGPAPAVPEKAPAPAPAEPARTTPPSTTAAVATPPAAQKPTDITGVVRTYSGCYAGCFSERASATNRETCKLNCDASAEAILEGLAGAPPKDVFARAMQTFTGCVNACYDDKTLSATNRETCVLTCQDTAEVAASPPVK